MSQFPPANPDAALPIPVVTASGRSLRIPMRPLKIGIGASLLMAGMYGVVSERQFLSSDSAVVTAYLTDLRTPIDGVVSGTPSATGARIERGALLAQIDNPLLDQPGLQSLVSLQQQAQSGAAEARAEGLALQAQEQELLARAALHMDAVSARLQGQRAEADRLLAARVADLEEAGRELARGKQLHDAGILADSEFERLQSRTQIAAAGEAAQRAAVSTLDSQMRSTAAGVLSEAGANSDVPYSRQRADEIELRLAENRRSQSAFEAQASGARFSLDAERARNDRMRHAGLLAPVGGILWKLDAVNGERVAAGDAVAGIVDCSHAFLLAEVPQDRVPDIAIGAAARLRLSGESRQRYGKVFAIGGDPQRDEDRKLAAYPASDAHRNLATVRISLDSTDGDDCPVGRSGTVLISISEGSPIIRAWRAHF